MVIIGLELAAPLLAPPLALARRLDMALPERFPAFPPRRFRSKLSARELMSLEWLDSRSIGGGGVHKDEGASGGGEADANAAFCT